MIEKISYFTASYRDGRVYLGGKGKDAGYYAAQLLNEYDKDEFAEEMRDKGLMNESIKKTLSLINRINNL